MLVSVIVPMQDEEGSLPSLARELDGLATLLAARGHGLEAVLIDDGSTDGTWARAQGLAVDRATWRLLRHATNRGFGAGLRSGVAAARGAVLVSYDADCAYPAGDVLALLDALESGAQIAAATPFAEGGVAGASAFRIFVSRACSAAYRVVLRRRAQGVRTFTCAFRAYRAEVLRASPWRADGFLAAAEILCRALLAGVRVVEVPSTLRGRTAGASKMRLWRTALAHVSLLARLALTRRTRVVAALAGSGAAA